MIVIIDERPNPIKNSKLFSWLINQETEFLKKEYSDCIRSGLFHIGSEYYKALLFKKTSKVFERVGYDRHGGQMYAIVTKYKGHKRS